MDWLQVTSHNLVQEHGECVTGLAHSFSKQVFKHGTGLLKLPIYHQMCHVLKRQEMLKKALVEAKNQDLLHTQLKLM